MKGEGYGRKGEVGFGRLESQRQRGPSDGCNRKGEGASDVKARGPSDGCNLKDGGASDVKARGPSGG
jgi:hypothetical protein